MIKYPKKEEFFSPFWTEKIKFLFIQFFLIFFFRPVKKVMAAITILNLVFRKSVKNLFAIFSYFWPVNKLGLEWVKYECVQSDPLNWQTFLLSQCLPIKHRSDCIR